MSKFKIFINEVKYKYNARMFSFCLKQAKKYRGTKYLAEWSYWMDRSLKHLSIQTSCATKKLEK